MHFAMKKFMDGYAFFVFILVTIILEHSSLVFSSISQSEKLSLILRPHLKTVGYGSPLGSRTEELRPKRDTELTFLDDDVRELLQQEDYVSAILDYIELTHNRSHTQHCTRTSLRDHFRYDLSNRSFEPFERQAFAALKTANILTNLFSKDSQDNGTLYNEEFYYSLVKVNVQSDPLIYASGIGFQRGFMVPRGKLSRLLFAPYAFRQHGYVETKDLATAYNVTYDEQGSVGNEWFWQHALNNYTEFIQRKTNTDHEVSFSSYPSGDSDFMVSFSDGRWTSPYFECGGENTWLISFSVPFFGLLKNSTDFRGVAMISINLKNVDINQCAEDESMFSGTHKCDKETTECVHIAGRGFRRGSYRCHCKAGYYFPKSNFPIYFNNHVKNYFNGSQLENAFVTSRVRDGSSPEEGDLVYPDSFRCLPCQTGCETCVDGASCFAEYNMLLRSIALGLQSFCSTITFVLLIVAFRLRKSKGKFISTNVRKEYMDIVLKKIAVNSDHSDPKVVATPTHTG
ncbi:metabotropic glycine receptor-like [Tachypleus tridentatus]|uniref:metabotropic glycine receptor-like n=1 Tax=Tachypleus tridentatus TaxID=6853 RepID=UPI003FD1266F